ncbi:MAG: hypothetical protein D5R96_06145 [Methanocalculus sp. MSAO_Arc2]|nr:MAG: hypothetical protein D5R96_06145 [Methanocalculus sp. MSAO_Arc2]
MLSQLKQTESGVFLPTNIGASIINMANHFYSDSGASYPPCRQSAFCLFSSRHTKGFQMD